MASEAAAASAPAKGGLMGWIVWVVLSVLAAGSGAVLPWLLHAPRDHADEKPAAVETKSTVLPFGDMVVNLGEERLTRYLRLKVLLVCEETESKDVGERMEKQRAFLKSWLISYLSDQSLQEVSRAAGVNRLRREIRDQFNAMLYPDGSEKVHEILFDEFVVQ